VVVVQQTLPQQGQMLLAALVCGVADLDPDLLVSDVDGKGLEVVAEVVKAATALQVELAAVPIAGEHVVADHPAGQRVAPIWGH
jgi:hypothetical protein